MIPRRGTDFVVKTLVIRALYELINAFDVLCLRLPLQQTLNILPDGSNVVVRMGVKELRE